MPRDFSVTIDGVEGVVESLGIIPERSTLAAKRAINKTASKARTLGVKEIRDNVALKAKYVRDRIRIREATVEHLEATVSARKRPSLLSRYGAKQLTQKAQRAKGDPSRGIPAGRKQAGVSVRVKSGGRRKKMRGAFLIKLKAGKVNQAGAIGLAIRTGNGKDDYEVKYGPSIDQAWRFAIPKVREGLKGVFRQNMEHELSYELRRSRR